MRRLLKPSILFGVGGFTYVLFEIVWRGYSHWTMFVVGAICFLIIGGINEFYSWEMPLWKQCVISALIITAIEFISGCIVNLGLGWNVWDYSDTPFNVLGQICLPYTLLWIPVSLIGIILDDYLRYWLFKEEKPHYKLW